MHRNAILRFEEIPSGPLQMKKFDAQLRELFTLESIAEAVVEGQYDMAVCDLLAKHQWTAAERAQLFEIVEELYEG